MSKHPYEALLRDPVEMYSAVACFAGATLAIFLPQALMMTPSVAYAVAILLLLWGARRFKQALKLNRYHSGLRKLPHYVLSASKIPKAKGKLFLGLGFRWDERHTQRLFDASKATNKRFYKSPWYYDLARNIEMAADKSALFAFIAKYSKQPKWWNPCAPLPPVGGNLAMHAVGLYEGEKNIFMDLGERVGHSLVLGTTRVGKTRFAEILITQDIHRGDVVFVFDPKGDADLLKRMYAEAKRAGRLNEFKVFHLGYPEISVAYNPVGEFNRVTEVASRIAGQLPGGGSSAAFKEFVWRFANIVTKARVELGEKPSLEMIERDVTHIEPLLIKYYELWLDREASDKKWRNTINAWINAGKDDPNAARFKDLPFALRGRSKYPLSLIMYARENDLYNSTADGLRSAYEYDKTYADKITASLLPLMSKLTSGSLGKLLVPDYEDSKVTVLDWRKEIRSGGIVYVGLDALSDAEVAAAVGNSMFADLTSIAGEIYKFGADAGMPNASAASAKKVCIHADEFNELIGDEFIPMLNKAGGAGFQVTVYTQTWADVEARLGDKAKAEQVAGNLNTMFMLRVKNEDTANMLAAQLKDVHIHQLTLVSGATDDTNIETDVDFTSRTEDRISDQKVPMLQAADLTQLPKGQAFALIEGGQLYKLRLPLPNTATDNLPDNLQDVVDDMDKRYQETAQTWGAITSRL